MAYLAEWGQRLASRDGGWICHYCGLPLVRAQPKKQEILRSHGYGIATVDHKNPSSRGGRDCLHNFVLACRRCNQEKGKMPYEKYYQQTVRRRYRRRMKKARSC